VAYQIPLLQTESQWCAPEVLPNLTEAKQLAIDLETCDPNLLNKGPGWATGDGYIIGVALATDDWQGYFPVRHDNGSNLDRDLVFRWLKKQVSTDCDKIFHNAAYDVGWLKREGVEIKGAIKDTLIAAPLLDENRFSYSLNALAKTYIASSKNERVLQEAAREWGIDAKSEMWKLPAMYVGPYAEQDARATLDLWNVLSTEIRKTDLQYILDLELSLLPSLIEMRWRGVRVDLEKASLIQDELEEKEKQILHQIKKEYNRDVEIWNARSIGELFDKAKIEYDLTEKTQSPKIDRAFLQNHPHELPKLILEAREYNKANTTFINSILRYQHKGRIHAETHSLRSDQGGTVSGRFSYSNPNLQQIPARHKILGPMIRSIFVPEKGEKWVSIDYSQQEPRLVVHYASLLKLPRVDDVVEEYKQGEADFHEIVAEMAGIPRKQAKNINLGLFYSMGQRKLAEQLNIPLEDAQELFEIYHARVPFVKMLSDYCRNRASTKGYIRTVLGRKCRFDLWEPRTFGSGKIGTLEKAQSEFGPNIKRAFTHKALNRLIQGSAADQTKAAMRALSEKGYLPLLQVHDELCFSSDDPDQIKEIAEIMETCIDLEVPSKVDVEYGDSWGTAKTVFTDKPWQRSIADGSGKMIA
jgi:DNA polymerase I-like protein with 3'-5' exonuclease and polymerase domains|tara:strand:- start:1867 stop:3786 length:1920 start_codon:yes stop_codon:yes gene_type:complete